MAVSDVLLPSRLCFSQRHTSIHSRSSNNSNNKQAVTTTTNYRETITPTMSHLYQDFVEHDDLGEVRKDSCVLSQAVRGDGFWPTPAARRSGKFPEKIRCFAVLITSDNTAIYSWGLLRLTNRTHRLVFYILLPKRADIAIRHRGTGRLLVFPAGYSSDFGLFCTVYKEIVSVRYPHSLRTTGTRATATSFPYDREQLFHVSSLACLLVLARCFFVCRVVPSRIVSNDQ
jgi:hypothetical protein